MRRPWLILLLAVILFGAGLWLARDTVLLRIERRNFDGGTLQVGRNASFAVPAGSGTAWHVFRLREEAGFTVECHVRGRMLVDGKGLLSGGLPSLATVSLEGCEIRSADAWPPP